MAVGNRNLAGRLSSLDDALRSLVIQQHKKER